MTTLNKEVSMKIIADTPSGWMSYNANVKEGLGRTLSTKEVKDVMKKYISGQSWQTTVLEINNVSNAR
jgi:hypothetical protein